MSIFDKVFAAADALQAGKSLQKPAIWKRVQVLSPIFLILIGAIVRIFGLEISEPDQATISLGLATLGVAINSYLTVATTAKMGIKQK